MQEITITLDDGEEEVPSENPEAPDFSFWEQLAMAWIIACVVYGAWNIGADLGEFLDSLRQ